MYINILLFYLDPCDIENCLACKFYSNICDTCN